MVALLAIEAESVGTPLNDEEQTILASPAKLATIPPPLRIKVKNLIERILQSESKTDPDEDPKSFGNSLEWAGDIDYPNIAMLTEKVVSSGVSYRQRPPFHGRRWLKDRAQLVGCALGVVLVLIVIVVIVGMIFNKR